MFRAQPCAITGMGIGLMLCAASANATDLELQVDSQIGGDNNVFAQSDESVSDGYWEISPQISIIDPDEDELRYDIRYRPSYRTYFETGNINGFDHLASASTGWRATPTTTFGADGRFSRFRRFRLDGVFDQGLPSTDPDAGTLQESDDDLIQRGFASVYVGHSFTPRVSGQLAYQFEDIDFIGGPSVDTRAQTGTVSMSYSFDPQTTVGLASSGRFRNNDGDDSRNQFSSDTLSGDVQITLQRALTKTSFLSARVGPSFIKTTLEAPNGLNLLSGANQRTDTTTSVFATVELEKEWKTSSLLGTYIRSESGSGGTATASILDQVDLVYLARPTEKWGFRLLGQWSEREDLSTGAVPNQIVRRYRVVTTVRRRFWRNLSASFQFSFVNQRRERGSDRSTTNFLRGFVGIRYEFDRFRF